ncbi:hypothetical protein HOE04_01895 [archaeon]|jgi:hypothetical protein|nr:hypothetical protein [archaeon]
MEKSNADKLISGVTRTYDNLKNSTEYMVCTNGLALVKTPKEQRKFLQERINVLMKDVRKQGLEKFAVSLEGEHNEVFREQVEELSQNAGIQNIGYSNSIYRNFNIGGAICGILGGIVAYNYGSELATGCAEYLNDASHLLAPITGALQFVGSVSSAFVGGVMGWVGGRFGSGVVTLPLSQIKYPLAKDSGTYQDFYNLIRNDKVDD